MHPAIQIDVRAKQRPSPDSDETGVNDRAVVVDERTFADFDVVSVVDSDRWFNPWLVSEQLLVCLWVVCWWR